MMNSNEKERITSMYQDLYSKLVEILGAEKVLKDEPMKSHTTFKIGGPADFFVLPKTNEEVI